MKFQGLALLAFVGLAVLPACNCGVPPVVNDAGIDSGVGACTTSECTEQDAGFDSGMPDAGVDAGFDAGVDAGFDAGFDAGIDSGIPQCDETSCPTGQHCANRFPGDMQCIEKCWPGLDNCYGTGISGALVVPANTFPEINRYTAVIQAVDADAGVDNVAVQSTTGFNVGGLVLVWQSFTARGALSQGNSDALTLEDAGVGQYEAARIQAIANGRLTFTKPLLHAYEARGAQVVSVPEYTTVTISLDAGIGREGNFREGSFNGETGGIVAFLANGAVVNNGKISMAGSGFKGGSNPMSFNVQGCAALDGETNSGGGAPKGTGFFSITGAQVFGMGRVGHAGGGGDRQNSGGGGGGHGGRGGRGGRTESADGSRDVGGWGGASVSYGDDRLMMGGGGGAGHGHRSGTSAGAVGGGVVLVAAQSISGPGTIEVSGRSTGVVPDGANKYGSYVDGIGGGGGGGLIDVRTFGGLACGVMDASGGRGLACNGTVGGSAGSGGGGMIRAYVGSHAGLTQCSGNVSGGPVTDNDTEPLLNATPGTAGRIDAH